MLARCRSTTAWWGLGAVIGVVGLSAVRHPNATRARLRGGRRRIERRAHQLAGKSAGLGYRLSGQHPDEAVSDLVLADRVRSEIGPLIRTLDLPHVHVMVQDHIVTLHGDTATQDEAAKIDEVVSDVSGVRGVRSHLHVGLLASDTRPSTGRSQEPSRSAALSRLISVAADAGAVSGQLFTLRSVLATFLENLPEGERRHVLAHLPADVRRVAMPPRVWGDDRVGTVAELITEVAATDPSLDEGTARSVVEAVLAALADLVPEERDDVAAVLPRELRELWQTMCVRRDEATRATTAW